MEALSSDGDSSLRVSVPNLKDLILYPLEFLDIAYACKVFYGPSSEEFNTGRALDLGHDLLSGLNLLDDLTNGEFLT